MLFMLYFLRVVGSSFADSTIGGASLAETNG